MGLFSRKRQVHEIAPDEIFLDSSNLPGHETSQFEGRVVAPLSQRAIIAFGILFCLLVAAFGVRAFSLEVRNGDTYAEISRNNTLQRSLLFAERGLILDREGYELAWNQALPEAATSTSPKDLPQFPLRTYTRLPGLSHVLGYIQYPKSDREGNWWREEFIGVSGSELAFDEKLRGENGNRMVETNARGDVERENIIAPAQRGQDLRLTIDADVQSHLYSILSAHAKSLGYVGGAAAIMDVHNGELLALTSFPEYDNNAFTEGDSAVVRAALSNPNTPLLNRAVSGLYTPGSIVKPMFAAAALNEGIISPEKKILSKGAITIPNPYDPSKPSIFRDWTAHGLVDMREAIAVSSDEYFYTVGGGYGGQQGLGITKIDAYSKMFGLGSTTGFIFNGEAEGVIQTPTWKAQVFGPDDPWRIGDTYNTAIGQYGFQMTPLQALRFTAAIANGGTLMTPRLSTTTPEHKVSVGIPDQYLKVAREGMRLAVTSNRSDSTLALFRIAGIQLAGKTGTAQVGARNQWVNVWSVGFWPYDNPRYAFAVVYERGPGATPVGTGHGMKPFFEWLVANHPEYLN